MKLVKQTIKPETLGKALSFALILPLLDSCSQTAYSARNPSFQINSEYVSSERSDPQGTSPLRNDCLLVASERIYMGGSLTADWAVLVLENVAGSSTIFNISNPNTHQSTVVSIPQWGTRNVRIGSRSIRITVSEISQDTPSWADIEAYSNCN